MTLRSRLVLTAAVLAALPLPLLRADETYIGTNASWFDTSAWSNHAVPTAIDNVFITPAGSNTLFLNGAASAQNIFLGSAGTGTATLNLNGSSLTANSLNILTTGQLTGNGTVQTTVANAGSIVTSGQLFFSLPANITSWNTGTMTATEFGDLTLSGSGNTTVFDNTNGTLAANGNATYPAPTAHLDLNNLAFTGGQLTTNNGGQIRVNSANLRDTSLSGNILLNGGSLQNVALAGTVLQTGQAILAGTITNNAAWTTSTSIALAGSTTLNGSGSLTFSNAQLTSLTSPGTLTIGANQTLNGSGTFSNIVFNNAGTITANASNPLTLSLFSSQSTLTNTGTLSAVNGGTLTITDTASVLTNVGGTIAATGAGPSQYVHSVVSLGSTTVYGGAFMTDATGEIHSAGNLVNISSNANLFLDGNANLTNDTFAGNVIEGSSTVTLVGIITNNAAWNMAAPGGSIQIAGSVSLLGNGTLTLSNTNLTYYNSSNAILTVGPAQSILGYGTLSPTLFNAGTISATSPLNSLRITVSGVGNVTYPSMVNTGTLSATNGATLQVSGNSSFSTTILNANGTISATGSNGTAASHAFLTGATIIGGQLTTDASGIIDLNNVVLNGITSNGTLNANGSVSFLNGTLNGNFSQVAGTTVTLAGTLTNNATWNVDGGISVAPNTRLAGTGTVLLHGGQIYSVTSPSDLTVGAGQTIKGYGTIAGNGASLVFNNAGTVSADPTIIANQTNLAPLTVFLTSSPSILTVAPVNTGTLQAVGGGTLILAGTGSFPRLDNTGGTILSTGFAFAGSPASSVTIQNLDITGGQILSSASGQISLINGSLSDLLLSANTSVAGLVGIRNVTLAGSLVQSVNSLVTLGGTITNNALWTTTDFSSNITFSSATIINGNGSIALAGGAIDGTPSIPLSIGSNQTVHGGGTIVALSAILNSGHISADSSSLPLTIYPSLVNTGTLSVAHAATLTLNGSLAGSAGITHVDGTLQLNGLTNTAGAITGNGTLALGGNAFLQSDGLQVTALTINGRLQIRPSGTSTGTSKVQALTLSSSASFDLTNNALIVAITDSTTKPALEDAIAAGTSETAGLFSSTAGPLVLIDNSERSTPYATFGGLPVDANSLLIAPAEPGDATLDGTVDLNDLNTVLNHLGAANSAWTSGNFDGAASVDLNDLNDVLNHLGTSLGANPTVTYAESLVAAAPTPEPASLALLLPSLLLIRRRLTA